MNPFIESPFPSRSHVFASLLVIGIVALSIPLAMYIINRPAGTAQTATHAQEVGVSITPEGMHQVMNVSVSQDSDIMNQSGTSVSSPAPAHETAWLGTAQDSGSSYTALRFAPNYAIFFRLPVQYVHLVFNLSQNIEPVTLHETLGVENTTSPATYTAVSTPSTRAGNLIETTPLTINTTGRKNSSITVDVTKQFLAALQVTNEAANSPISLIFHGNDTANKTVPFDTYALNGPKLVVAYQDGANTTLDTMPYTQPQNISGNTDINNPNGNFTATLHTSASYNAPAGSINDNTVTYTFKAVMHTSSPIIGKIACASVAASYTNQDPKAWKISPQDLINSNTKFVGTYPQSPQTDFTLTGTFPYHFENFSDGVAPYYSLLCIGLQSDGHGGDLHFNPTNGLSNGAVTETAMGYHFPDLTPGKNTQNVKVATLHYVPVDQSGKNVNAKYLLGTERLQSNEQRVNLWEQQVKESLDWGSVYQGYNRGTTPNINYNIVYTNAYTDVVPLSTKFNEPDYRTMLNKENICNLVDQQGVKEVWLFTYFINGMTESNMAMGNNSKQYWNNGTYGDISNSDMANDLPVCNHTYVLYNFLDQLSRGMGLAVHSHGHQIESEMNAMDANAMGNEFMYLGAPSKLSNCGWTHYTPNDPNQPQYDYNYDNETPAATNCTAPWSPHSVSSAQVNCHNWYGTDHPCQYDDGLKYYIWWRQSIPAANNTAVYNGFYMRNWWDFMVNFDKAIAAGQTLNTSRPVTAYNIVNQPSTLNNQLNKTLLTTAFDANGNEWSTTETNNQWQDWTNMNGPSGVTLYGTSLETNPDGRLEVFAIGSDGALWHNWQHTPNGPWFGWSSLGTPNGVKFVAQTPVTNINGDNSINVFMLGSDGNIWHNWESPNWQTWGTLNKIAKPKGTTFLPDRMAVWPNANEQLEVFAVDTTGQMWMNAQQGANNENFWGWAVPANNKTVSGKPVAFINADQTLQIIAKLSTGELGYITQLSPNSGSWTQWNSIPQPAGATISRYNMTRPKDGELKLAGVGSDNNLYIVNQDPGKDSWNGSWIKSSIGGTGNYTNSSVELGYDANANLTIILTNATGAEVSGTAVQNGSSWSWKALPKV